MTHAKPSVLIELKLAWQPWVNPMNWRNTTNYLSQLQRRDRREGSSNPSSGKDARTLPSEYNDLRDSVRSLSEKEIAPHAHAVDEDHRYPQEADDALVKAGLFASHVPLNLVEMAQMHWRSASLSKK
jgi:hypothetical protein